MSMKPGATTRPLASSRARARRYGVSRGARRERSVPTNGDVTMNHAAPVPRRHGRFDDEIIRALVDVGAVRDGGTHAATVASAATSP